MLDLGMSLGVLRRAVSALTRKVAQTNGVDQYGKLAKPITGVGQGKITLVAKVADLGAPQYLFDGDSASNRLFCYLDTSGNTIRSAGLTATVNGSGSVVAWGSQAIIEVAGDFTGLVLATLLRQYDPVFFTKAQPFYFKYEDEAQTVEFAFDSGLGYDLPVGAVVGRDQVDVNSPAIANAAWTNNGDGSWTLVGDGSYQNLQFLSAVTTAGKVWKLEVTVDSISGGNLLIAEAGSSVIITEPGTYSFAVKGDNVPAFKRGSGSVIATISNISMREVPNALIWQNNPTWADYVQQPNGDWLLKGSDPAEYIVLSDYQRNQFYIEQAEKAIAGYQAKQNSRWVTKADGVDDHLQITVTLPAGATIKVGFIPEAASAARQYIFDGPVTNRGFLSIEPTTGYVHTNISGTLKLDGEVITSNTVSPEFGKQNKVEIVTDAAVSIDVTGRKSDASVDWFNGSVFDLSVLDHTAPLPIGQGGNSGYWPLNDPDNTVRNVLGKDAKGNLVAKEGINLNGYGTWQGNPTRELYTLDKVDGSLLGPELHDTSLVFVKDDAFDEKIDINYIANKLYQCSARVFDYISGDVSVRFSNNDPLTNSVSGNGYISGRAQSSSAGSQLEIPISTALASVTDVSFKEVIPLSPELQRQYDLAQVEAKISKLDKLYSKVVPLLTLDGVDDQGNIPRITLSGKFRIPFSFQLNASSNEQILGDTDNGLNRLSVNNDTQMGCRLASQTMTFAVPSLGTSLHTGYFEADDAGVVTLMLDGVKYSEDANLTYTGSVTFNVVGQVANTQRFAGKLGPVPMIDYASPLNSRYLVPTATGLVDMLGDGSTDGTYQGNPVPPQTFTKVGDDLYGEDFMPLPLDITTWTNASGKADILNATQFAYSALGGGQGVYIKLGLAPGATYQVTADIAYEGTDMQLKDSLGSSSDPDIAVGVGGIAGTFVYTAAKNGLYVRVSGGATGSVLTINSLAIKRIIKGA